MAPLLSTPLLRTQSDRRLVALAADGHERAFEAIVERYRRPLQRYLRRLLQRGAGRGRAAGELRARLAGAARGNRGARPAPVAVPHRPQPGAQHAARGRRCAAAEHRGASPPCSLEAEVERREELRETLHGIAGAARAPARGAASRSPWPIARMPRSPRELGMSDGALRQLLLRARTTLRAAATALTPYPLVTWLAGGQEVDAPRASPRSPSAPAARAWRSRPAPPCSRPERWWPAAPRCAATTSPRRRRPRPSPRRPIGPRRSATGRGGRRVQRGRTRPARSSSRPRAPPRSARARAAPPAPTTMARARPRTVRAPAATAPAVTAARGPTSVESGDDGSRLGRLGRGRLLGRRLVRQRLVGHGVLGRGLSVGQGLLGQERLGRRRPGAIVATTESAAGTDGADACPRLAIRRHPRRAMARAPRARQLRRWRLGRRRLRTRRLGRRLIERSCVTRAAGACPNRA